MKCFRLVRHTLDAGYEPIQTALDQYEAEGWQVVSVAPYVLHEGGPKAVLITLRRAMGWQE